MRYKPPTQTQLFAPLAAFRRESVTRFVRSALARLSFAPGAHHLTKRAPPPTTIGLPLTMTNREVLVTLAPLLYQSEAWSRALARDLNIDSRLVRRWRSGQADVPDWAARQLKYRARTRARRLDSALVSLLREQQEPDSAQQEEVQP